MTENFSPELINECTRDLCFQNDHCTADCYALNCENTWLAEELLRNGWVKLPVYIGKPVWVASVYYNNLTKEIHTDIAEGKISMLQQKADQSWKFRVTAKYILDYTLDAIGKDIFFAREEAEEGLKKKIKSLEEKYLEV